MLSEEEKKAIEYLENRLDILHNNTQWATEKSIKVVLNLIDKQQKEIEEKTTIIMAGAEKVKQLEKEIQRLEKDNDTLSELVIVNEDKVIKELDLISKDKIREKIKELELLYNYTLETTMTSYEMFHFVRSYIDKVKNILNELLEEK